jgi:hypothetical protein
LSRLSCIDSFAPRATASDLSGITGPPRWRDLTYYPRRTSLRFTLALWTLVHHVVHPFDQRGRRWQIGDMGLLSGKDDLTPLVGDHNSRSRQAGNLVPELTQVTRRMPNRSEWFTDARTSAIAVTTAVLCAWVCVTGHGSRGRPFRNETTTFSLKASVASSRRDERTGHRSNTRRRHSSGGPYTQCRWRASCAECVWGTSIGCVVDRGVLREGFIPRRSLPRPL